MTLPRPVYAVDASGRFALSLNMARLDAVRPGYGYVGGLGAALDDPAPAECGVWRMALDTDPAPHLLLSLADARRFLLSHLPLKDRLRHRLAGYRYWFNHAKIAPGGGRFTVKLRWRRPGRGWNETMGVSLTVDAETGGDLRLLADATSHVIWQDDRHLYFWRRDEVALYEDTGPVGTRVGPVLGDRIKENVHIRHIPPGPAVAPKTFVLDTPYQETVTLELMDGGGGASQPLATFDNHVPARGPFRCDLHPVPSADGRRIVVTSMHDGGRQVYALTRTGDGPSA